jgi:predicted dienelactone hydrolase
VSTCAPLKQRDNRQEETIFGGAPAEQVFAPVVVAPGAEISRAPRNYPLVLLPHGTGGSAVHMMWLGYYLAARGYIVAAVNHRSGANQIVSVIDLSITIRLEGGQRRAGGSGALTTLGGNA